MSDEASGTKSLRDRVAIVTGSGQGIGRGVAMCLAHAGAHVVIADQATQGIASVKAAVEDLGVQALGIPTDVSRADDVERMIRQTVERFGKIDILVNNAGTLVVKPMVEQTEEEWDRVPTNNRRGLFDPTTLLTPLPRHFGLVNHHTRSGLAVLCGPQTPNGEKGNLTPMSELC
jgi:NAD(P)-dependent dehydrogenase (short-subunit alcohol dehydrogenase family)